MTRGIASVIGGLIAWLLIATVGNLVLRFAWASYAEVEKSLRFTAEMMAARLVLGALASLVAGYTAALIAKRNGAAVKVLAGILLAMFVPVHYGLWEKFPVWYHAVFLAYLIVMTLLGGVSHARRAAATGNPSAKLSRQVGIMRCDPSHKQPLA